MSSLPLASEKLPRLSTRIRDILEHVIEPPSTVPGVVYLALDRTGSVLVHECSGVINVDTREPVTPENIWGINSGTKIVTAIAAMKLVERGLLTLDGPIEQVLPELAHLQILLPDGTLAPTKGTKITLGMLLKHNAGFGYSFNDPVKAAYLAENAGGNEMSGRKEGLLQPVVAFEPGTRFRYGSGMDWVGEAVARVSGQTLGAYCRKHIFDPLGAEDITFVLSPVQRKRLVTMHIRDSVSGQVTTATHQPYINWPTSSSAPEPYHAGGHGLLSTSLSLARVILPLITSGNGVLQPATVQLMLEDAHEGRILDGIEGEFADLWPENEFGMRTECGDDSVPARGFGFAGGVGLAPWPTGRSKGSVFWLGAANVHWQADPTRGIVSVLMMQMMPMNDRAAMKVLRECETALYEELGQE